MRYRNPNVLQAPTHAYVHGCARTRVALREQEHPLAVLRDLVAGLNFVYGLIPAVLFLWAVGMGSLEAVLFVAPCLLAVTLNVISMWPCRSRVWISAIAALVNSLWLLIIGLPITLSSPAEDMLLVAFLFAVPHGCALALQATALVYRFGGKFGQATFSFGSKLL